MNIFNPKDHIQTKYLFYTGKGGLGKKQLPSAWTNFFDKNTTGTSCMGQLSGLDEERDNYRLAVETLADGDMTALMLVRRPEEGPLAEANRASLDLSELNINNQKLIINGILETPSDAISENYFQLQQSALNEMPEQLNELPSVKIPLRPYNLASIEKLSILLEEDQANLLYEPILQQKLPRLQTVIDDLNRTNKGVIFTMGKAGVGKNTIAASIAKGLVAKGKKFI